MADWPHELLRLWNKFALSGEVDAQHPPATVQEAYEQVIGIQARHLREVAQDIRQDVACLVEESEDELLPVNLRRTLAVCAECGATHLDHFYTSKRDGRTVCHDCFQQRKEQGVARKPASADS